MLIARLSISYDRGVRVNKTEDLAMALKPLNTPDGKGVIRGLGTHFVSVEEMEKTKARDKEASRLRAAFAKTFLVTILDGIFYVREKGMAKEFLVSLKPLPQVVATVTEFDLLSTEPLQELELKAWSKRVKSQFGKVSLGRTDEADAAGLETLLSLADCPALAAGTKQQIVELVEQAKLKKLTRVELRRSIDVLDMQIDPLALSVQPRRQPVAA